MGDLIEGDCLGSFHLPCAWVSITLLMLQQLANPIASWGHVRWFVTVYGLATLATTVFGIVAWVSYWGSVYEWIGVASIFAYSLPHTVYGFYNWCTWEGP